MNPIQFFEYGRKRGNLTPNTFIGGVATSIPNKETLAAKLNISSSNISYFNIEGTNIEAKIDVNYSIPNDAFKDDLSITSFIETSEGKCISTGTHIFWGASNFIRAEFQNDIVIRQSMFLNSGLKRALFRNSQYMENFHPFGGTNAELIYLPKYKYHTNAGSSSPIFGGAKNIIIPEAIEIGGTTGNNNHFSNCPNGVNIWANIFLQTSNAGAEEGDLAYARSTKLANIDYSGVIPDFITPPNEFSVSNVGSIYGTSIQLIDDNSSVNSIVRFTEVKVDGVARPDVKVNRFIGGLTLNTTYQITCKKVDIFESKSDLQTVSITTASTELYPTGKIAMYLKLEDNLNDSFSNFDNSSFQGSGLNYVNNVLVNKSLNFPGTGSVALPQTIINNPTNFAVAYVGKMTDTLAEYRNLELNAGGFPYVSVRANSGGANRMVIDIWSPSSNQVLVTGYTLTNKFTLILSVTQNLHYKVYFQGILVSTKAMGAFGNPGIAGNTLGGVRGAGTTTRTKGDLDEFVLITTDLTDDQALEIHNKLINGEHLI